jgi:hypothetical protein
LVLFWGKNVDNFFVSGFFLAGKNFFRGRQSKDLGEDRLNEVQKYLTCIRIIYEGYKKGNL